MCIRDRGYSGYGVQYSPFYDNKLAVATGSNFGLVGNGKLFILDIDPHGRMVESNSFLTQDGLFDVAWNEGHANQVLAAQGDGSLRLFDINLPQYPISIFQEHQKEVFSCNWNLVNKQTFVSSSWDGTVKIWSPMRQESLTTLVPIPMERSPLVEAKAGGIPLSNQQNHSIISKNKDCIYQAQFSPHDPNLIMCCAGNSYVTLFDLRQPTNTNQQNFMSHGGLETLTCDFNKYRPHIVATGGVDKLVKIWDLRMVRKFSNPLQQPMSINEIPGHELAIRKVSWSPHHSNLVLSTSYDMTCRVWDDLSDSNGGSDDTKASQRDPNVSTSIITDNLNSYMFEEEISPGVVNNIIENNIWVGTDIRLFKIANFRKESFSFLEMTSSFFKKFKFINSDNDNYNNNEFDDNTQLRYTSRGLYR